MTIEKSGVAFPCAHEGGQKGMTLRDYFAAKVLPAALADFYAGGEEVWNDHDDVAEHCYRVADAMLKAREKNEDLPRRLGVGRTSRRPRSVLS